jgi:hypothetical protein
VGGMGIELLPIFTPDKGISCSYVTKLGGEPLETLRVKEVNKEGEGNGIIYTKNIIKKLVKNIIKIFVKNIREKYS